jgi:hypothetical protein
MDPAASASVQSAAEQGDNDDAAERSRLAKTAPEGLPAGADDPQPAEPAAFVDTYVTFTRDSHAPSGWKAWFWDKPYEQEGGCYKARIPIPRAVIEREEPDMVIEAPEPVEVP